MLTSKQKVKDWRVRTKARMVQAMGNKCQICGYDKCQDSMDFHHINPEEKEFGMGSIRATPISWEKIIEELRKCILLCANCHAEYHAGITDIPENFATFDEAFIDYKTAFVDDFDRCPVCNGLKMPERITCGRSCQAKKKYLDCVA